MNPNPVPALPIPADTTDVRSGPDVHPGILPLLPLLGEWTGVGQGDYPTIEEFHYGQWIRFSHDGRPFLAYESRTWLIGLDGEIIRPAAREVGWWRSSGGDDFEALLAHPTGIVEVYVGRSMTTTSWELATDVVARTATAKEVAANKRLYGIVDGALMYAVDMAAQGQELQPHLSARLERVVPLPPL
ncbi:MAG: FABP family protein [Geodermatophilaceae bacterium]|nr:FABP family protein [Geodermatophilaceae bacterium]